jgi:outer membrane protein assembly factor BamB
MIGVCVPTGLVLAVIGVATGASPAAAQSKSVLTYHGDATRAGHFVAPGLTWDRARQLHADAAFKATVAGPVYAQPLFWHPPGSGPGLVVVATEGNVVYALNAESGAEVWKRSVGAPVPRSALSCGNINPVGVTGTPVIDARSQTVYLDAMVSPSASGEPQHLIYALSLRDGSVLSGWPVNVADALRARGMRFLPKDQNQRGALLVLGDRVYVPYGGHWGDCGTYRGWVVSVDLRDARQVTVWSTRARGGGIWAPAGIASDGQSLFVTTGNTFGVSAWSDGEAIMRLSPALETSGDGRDYFAPADWKTLDNSDGDLGGTTALPLDLRSSAGPSGIMLGLGKDGKAYAVDRARLGGIGGQLASETVADGAIRTAAAAWPARDGIMVAFQGKGAACPAQSTGTGLTALVVGAGAPPTIRTAWCARLNGGGAPIVTTSDDRADAIVWATGGDGDNRLHGYRGDTGAEIFAGDRPGDAMRGLRHFGTIVAANNRLYVPADGRVYAFTW